MENPSFQIATMTAETFRRGTMVIDIRDVQAKRLVWRGTVSRYLHESPARVNRPIDDAIAQAVKAFHPSS
jgi:hypothetical protein